MGGIKVWNLLPPDALTEADGLDLNGPNPQNCYGINPFNGPGEHKKWLVAVVHPGNVMVVPIGWWHCVHSYDANLSANTWYTKEDIRSLHLGTAQDTAMEPEVTVDLSSSNTSPVKKADVNTGHSNLKKQPRTKSAKMLRQVRTEQRKKGKEPFSSDKGKQPCLTSKAPDMDRQMHDQISGNGMESCASPNDTSSDMYSGQRHAHTSPESPPLGHTGLGRQRTDDSACRQLQYANSAGYNSQRRTSASPPLSKNASPSLTPSAPIKVDSLSQAGTSGRASPSSLLAPPVPEEGHTSLAALRDQLATISRRVEQLTREEAAEPLLRGQRMRRRLGVFPPQPGTSSLPPHLARFRHICAAPVSGQSRFGFRFTIPAALDVKDLGFNSTVKDACASLHGAGRRKLKVPSAPPERMLNITCGAHGHGKANDTKSHLSNSRHIENIHADLNKFDRHINIARVSKMVCDKMVTKWTKQYREPEFAAKLSTYFKRALFQEGGDVKRRLWAECENGDPAWNQAFVNMHNSPTDFCTNLTFDR